MKEITRIHLAKIAYDIEIDAKKDIQSYIAALERYADDPELLGDIEIRITELLTERGVSAGGVITKDDVAAVRAQLGEPSDFASEGVEVEKAVLENEPRRVYRDEDNAVLGGVLAGFGKFFGVDPLWVRLIFIVLLFASFGTALLVYAILWFIIPPAQTATEKLRMSGRTVTLASIKELAGNEEQRNERAHVMQKVLSVIAGAILVLVAIAGLLAIVAVVFGVQFGFWRGEFAQISGNWAHESWWFIVMMALFIVSGLLFSALCFLLASAAFRRQWSKRIGIAVITIITAGLVVFASGIGVGVFGYTEERGRIADLVQTTRVDEPDDFSTVQTMTVASDDDAQVRGLIEYIVSDTPRYELKAMPGVEPQFQIADDGLSMTVKLVDMGSDDRGVWDFVGGTTLTIYGPELKSIDVRGEGQTVRYHTNNRQEEITVALGENAKLGAFGEFDAVRIKGTAGSRVSLDNATIDQLYVEGGWVSAGVVQILDVKQPDACPAYESIPRDHFVHAQAVSGGKIIYNGKERPAESIRNDCGRIIIGDEFDMGRELY